MAPWWELGEAPPGLDPVAPPAPGAGCPRGHLRGCSCRPGRAPAPQNHVSGVGPSPATPPARRASSTEPGAALLRLVPQLACSVKAQNGSLHLLQPGDIWSDPGNGCIKYHCEKVHDQLILVTEKMACPNFDPNTCPLESVTTTEDGCCRICSPQGQERCAVQKLTLPVTQHGCRTAAPVDFTFCKGNCKDTASIYSLDALALLRQCICCQERETEQRSVVLHCPDGSSRDYSYIYVRACACVQASCRALPPATAPARAPRAEVGQSSEEEEDDEEEDEGFH
ncbi:mucin-5AC-like [Ornithorhynchus anatinus]|uniref:mucin-5AC-like n=1 Tax=Ornithorhynchus anatinus TaxID=9258 RepID=UPI0010A819F0|nr:mucin-5AC-like [Ornithorhynchus anatinus]